MGRRSGESIGTWYERAIVANSIAADDLHEMGSGDIEFNPTARKAITRRADDAARELGDALAAYLEQRAASSIGAAIKGSTGRTPRR